MKPSLKKPGDFTVAEGHGHPLVVLKLTWLLWFDTIDVDNRDLNFV